MAQSKKAREEIQEILDQIHFMDREFRLLDKGEGFLLQMTYLEPDVLNVKAGPVLQSTRKYYLSPFMTETEIVETAWLCVQRSQIHVASEHFMYQGARVYSQHFHIAGRLGLCDMDQFDGREPIEK